MADLIGSADTARFSSTYAIDSGVNNANRIWYVGNNNEANNSNIESNNK